MSACNYPLEPNRYQRRILAVLATAQLMAGNTGLTYGGLLMEDIRDRLPSGKRDRATLSSAMRVLIDSGYVALGSRSHARGASDQVGLFQCYLITAKGLRVTLGVLG